VLREAVSALGDEHDDATRLDHALGGRQALDRLVKVLV
jgi:hypothetical protein